MGRMKLKGFNLIAKNSFKNAFKLWPLLLGLTLLILVFSLVVSLMSGISNQVIGNYNHLALSSNLRDVVGDVPSSLFVKTSTDGESGGVPKNNVEAQEYYFYQLSHQYAYTNPQLTFSWSRTEGRNFSSIQNDSHNLTIKAVAKTTPNSSKYTVDQLAISQGHGIQSIHQTVIDATFGKKNHIMIGDIIRFQEDSLGSQLLVKSKLNKMDNLNAGLVDLISNLDDPNDNYQKLYSTYQWFQVVGYGESIDYVMPIIDQSTPLPNKKTELIAYVDPVNFGLFKDTTSAQGLTYFDQNRSLLTVASSQDSEAYFSLKFNNTNFKKISGTDLRQMNVDLLTLMGRDKDASDEAYHPILFKNGDQAYQYAGRTAAIISTIKIYQLLSGIILIVVLIVTIFTIVLVTQKQIDGTRSQIGTLKALGYYKREIVWNYVALPLMSSWFGGILGFIVAQFVQMPINKLFTDHFNLDLSSWTFDIAAFMVVVLAMWLFVTAVTFLIAYLTMSDDVVKLVYATKNARISQFGYFVKSLTNNRSIEVKLRSALFGSSEGKIAGVGFVVLLSTILMTITFAAPTLLKNNQTAAYQGIKYQQLVEFNTPVYNNPYTFMKTYDAQVTSKTAAFNYSQALNKITSQPLTSSGNYDLDKIVQQLLNAKIPNEYYDLEFAAQPDGVVNPLQVMTTNLRMLNSYSVVLSTQYFHLLADFAQLDPFGWNILSNQWTGYLDFINQIQAVPNTGSELLQATAYFNILKSFYQVYTQSIGLVITKDYYDNPTNVAMTYDEQITAFNNKIKSGNLTWFATFKGEHKGSTKSFGDYLTTLQPNPNFSLTTSTYLNDEGVEVTTPIGANHILSDKNGLSGNEGLVDQYLSADANQIVQVNGATKGLEIIKSYLADYLGWYDAYFSQRAGAAIVQTGFTRAPYFVQQYFKKAYYANENDQVYNFSFATIPYSPDQEQLGIKLSMESLNANPLTFNIYGVENNNKFLALQNNHHNLMPLLFNSAPIDDEATPIIVNQSLAKKLHLKTNQVVDFNRLYEEMENYTSGSKTAYKVSDWNQSDPRKEGGAGFVTTSSMDSLSTTLKNPVTGKQEKISAGALNIDNTPGQVYENYLGGDVGFESKKAKTTFKIVGIADMYGTPQGWIANTQAKTLMNYDQAQAYLWAYLFAPQFAKTFATTTKIKFPYDLRNLTYKEFKTLFLLDDDNKYYQDAKNIDLIFNHAYPIFNFKYSLSDDIGDLQAGIATYSNLGDYSPIALNGGVAQDKTYDGIGMGAISTLTPIQISQEILTQITNMILGILIMVILLVIFITFVIVMLTTSLIIKDNVRFIATLKVLGYKNTTIVNMVLGMYAVMIVIAFSIGYVGGWFSLTGIIHNLALHTNFVVPIVYPVFLIFAVMGGVIGIYGITFLIGYRYVTKTNATLVLKDQEI